MPKTILIATRNEDKVREITDKLAPLGVTVKSFLDFPEIPEVIEDGETLEANALKKAETGFKATGLPTLADDTGLEVDALGGAPGVYSSRYAGEEATYSDNRRKLIEAIKDVPDDKRQAAFRTVVTILDEKGSTQLEGKCGGIIITEERGDGTFGYDPVFYVPEYGQTFAEMDLKLKNKISHRGLAFGKAMEVIKEDWGL
ncbi:MAG: RdgB/HAM1 family non-canonical purine NTP pyrophosphatase [FCB group bacterium]|nr:RdgB/HAM1 family non-canonical purine NTP pyrophosphatase [FCB group bacterium]